MRIAFHSDAYAGQVKFGLGRYARELWNALKQQDSGIELMPFALRNKPDKTDHDCTDSNPIIRPGLDGRVVMGLWASVGLPRIEAWVGEVDIVHSVEIDYPVAVQSPWVTTVHDLGPLTHPEYFSKSRPWLRKQGILQAIKKADRIVSVSEATAEAVESIAGYSLGDRLVIIPEGVGDEFFNKEDGDCLESLDLPREDVPFFLWTGSLNPRKNLMNVLRAFHEIAADIPHALVLAGGLGWDHGKLLNEIEGSPFRNRIYRPGYVTDQQLRALYQKADGFVYVSFMEGFGLPILEAMAGGCPVVTSNISSMPEVAGDAALLVDPANHEDISQAMRELAGNSELRELLGVKGRQRAETYSWEKCGRAMLDIYRQVIK